jgi:hypothetical protein
MTTSFLYIGSSKGAEILSWCSGFGWSDRPDDLSKSRDIVLDPKYVDTIILRWQEFSGAAATLAQLRRDSPQGVRPVQGYPTIRQAVERRLSRGTALASATTEVISGRRRERPPEASHAAQT